MGGEKQDSPGESCAKNFDNYDNLAGSVPVVNDYHAPGSDGNH